jgi:hypothetical protein
MSIPALPTTLAKMVGVGIIAAVLGVMIYFMMDDLVKDND